VDTDQATASLAPADKPKYRRLGPTDHALILRLHQQGKTQIQIAKQFGIAQSTVSDVLAAFKDTRQEASRYLDGQALGMAMEIREKGKPSDLVAVLKGRRVLEEAEQKAFTLSINGVVLHGISQAGPSPRAGVIEGETLAPSESLAIHSGSDM
jgi:transcriptional regulator with XRE-family HTH domain